MQTMACPTPEHVLAASNAVSTGVKDQDQVNNGGQRMVLEASSTPLLGSLVGQ
jgi:hypothetical protein